MYRYVLVFALAGCNSGMLGGDDVAGDLAMGARDLAAPQDFAMNGSTDMAGVLRPYGIHVPAGYDKSKPTPLVVLLHGYGATAAIQDGYFGFDAASDAHGFLLALPNGTVDQSGKQFWNADDACCDVFHTGIDDVAFLSALIDDVKSKYNVDGKRVYFVGHSNGAFMSHRVACDLAPKVAAIAGLAGAVWKDPSKCQPSEPVAIAQIHGDADMTVPYAGGTLFPGDPPYPGAVETTQDWAAKDGCATTAVRSQQTYDLDGTLAGNETVVDVYPGCKGGAVELWTIQGGSHIPNLIKPTWGDTVWAFLAAHPKR